MKPIGDKDRMKQELFFYIAEKVCILIIGIGIGLLIGVII